jgi:hypothetical protein
MAKPLYLLLHTHRFGVSYTLFRSERPFGDERFLEMTDTYALEQLSYEPDREDEFIEVIPIRENDDIVDLDTYPFTIMAEE